MNYTQRDYEQISFLFQTIKCMSYDYYNNVMNYNLQKNSNNIRIDDICIFVYYYFYYFIHISDIFLLNMIYYFGSIISYLSIVSKTLNTFNYN